MLPFPPWSWSYVHPILVHYPIALIPVSFVADLIGRRLQAQGLIAAGRWSITAAAVSIIPATVAGWMIKPDIADVGVDYAAVLRVHQWLGVFFAVAVVIAFVWRWICHVFRGEAGLKYLAVMALLCLVLAYQGHLGGAMTAGNVSAAAKN